MKICVEVLLDRCGLVGGVGKQWSVLLTEWEEAGVCHLLSATSSLLQSQKRHFLLQEPESVLFLAYFYLSILYRPPFLNLQVAVKLNLKGGYRKIFFSSIGPVGHNIWWENSRNVQT